MRNYYETQLERELMGMPFQSRPQLGGAPTMFEGVAATDTPKKTTPAAASGLTDPVFKPMVMNVLRHEKQRNWKLASDCCEEILVVASSGGLAASPAFLQKMENKLASFQSMLAGGKPPRVKQIERAASTTTMKQAAKQAGPAAANSMLPGPEKVSCASPLHTFLPPSLTLPLSQFPSFLLSVLPAFLPS
jgi:hypothetical protein